MNHRFLKFFIITSGLLSQSYAGTVGSVTPEQSWQWVGSVSVGPIWANGGQTQTFNLTPEIKKTYVANKKISALASGELFVGINKPLFSQWLGQMGLALSTTGDVKLKGIIWDDASSQFDNHSYRYKVSSSRISLKGKLLCDKAHWFMPWVGVSLGLSFNRAHDFTNTPLIFEALPNPNFSSHTEVAFSYTLGAGVQKVINTHWQVGIGYEFSDWGNSHLGAAPGQTLNTGLSLNHLYNHGLLVNLTYVV